jgi:hypothetical protein
LQELVSEDPWAAEVTESFRGQSATASQWLDAVHSALFAAPDSQDDQEGMDDFYGEAAEEYDVTQDLGDDASAAHNEWIREHELMRRMKEYAELTQKQARSVPLPPSAQSVKNMFTSDQAEQILITEFMTLRKEGLPEGVTVEPIEYDLYNWCLQLRDFPSSSAIAKGLRRLSEDSRCGYDYVELQLKFVRGLHPFFPPAVQIVRPRLAGDAMWRVMNIAPLRLENWRPVRPRGMLDVIVAIKDRLASWAEIDIDHPGNALTNVGGAFSELEQILASLISISALRPRASDDAPDEEPLPERPPVAPAGDASSSTAPPSTGDATAPPSTDKPLADKYWAKGTGYSTQGKDTGWDPKAYIAAQAEQDRQLTDGLRLIRAYFNPLTPGVKGGLATARKAKLEAIAEASMAVGESATSGPDEWSASIPGPGSLAAASSSSAGELDLGSKAHRSAFIAEAEEEISKVGASGKPSEGVTGEALANELQDMLAVSLQILDTADMRSRVISESADVIAGSVLLPIIAENFDATTLMDLDRRWVLVRTLLGIIRGIASYSTLAILLRLPAESSLPSRSSRSVAEMLERKAMQAKAATGTTPSDREPPYDMLLDIIQTNDVVKAALSKVDPGDSTSASATAGASASAAASSTDDASEAQYCSVMKELQYGYMPGVSIPGFHYASAASSLSKSSRARIRQIGLEHSTLMESMPLSRSSTVFIRYPEARSDCIRAAIVGPEDTPYSGGIFLFDIFFPSEYPNCPPNVNLMTTGGGSVRFNPNLYANVSQYACVCDVRLLSRCLDRRERSVCRCWAPGQAQRGSLGTPRFQPSHKC